MKAWQFLTCLTPKFCKSFSDNFFTFHLQAKSAEMQAQCAPGTHKSSLQVQFDDKYSTLIKWLVNVGDAYLMSNNDMGDQLQTAMDFLQGHERLMEDMKVIYVIYQSDGQQYCALICVLGHGNLYCRFASTARMLQKLPHIFFHYFEKISLLPNLQRNCFQT